MRHATYTDTGHRVAVAMVAARLRQIDVAAELGISQSELSRRITGHRAWRDGELPKIAELCGVSLRSLRPRAPKKAA